MSFRQLSAEKIDIMFELPNILRLLSWLFRILLVVVFLYGGIPKLFSPTDFAVIISAYGLVPDLLVFPMAIFLPLLEVIIAIGLVLNYRWAMTTALILLIFFIAVLSYGMYLGLDIDCGCFGPENPEHGSMSGLSEARFRDLLLLIPAGYSWWFSYQNRK